MKEQFIYKNFHAKSLRRINQANAIIAEMKAQGYVLTLRQLYYQFVARDFIPNNQREYSNLGSLIDDARKAGLIDWNAIEDRTRFLRAIPHYRDVSDFVNKSINRYAEHLWADQDAYCEVWIEKDALVGVVERPCNEWRVPYFACRGYPSSSELYEAGKRLRRIVNTGKKVFVFYLGDHDPSGVHMPKSNDEWVLTYAKTTAINVVRLGLNMDQIEEHNPPPNPAKDTDSRYSSYVDEFGEECWELDALNPSVIDALIRTNIEALIDREKWDKALALEDENTKILEAFRDNVSDFKRYIKYRYNETMRFDTEPFTPEDILIELEGEDNGENSN